LECSAEGQPSPQIAWQKDGGNDFPAARERRMHMMPTDDVLFIVNVKMADNGIYSCTAQNLAGIIIANATLTILGEELFSSLTYQRPEIYINFSSIILYMYILTILFFFRSTIFCEADGEQRNHGRSLDRARMHGRWFTTSKIIVEKERQSTASNGTSLFHCRGSVVDHC